MIERVTIFAQGSALDFDLPLTGADLTPCRLEAVDEVESEYLTDAEMRRRERKNLVIVLQKTARRIKGVDGAAELLGLRTTTLISRIGEDGPEVTWMKEEHRSRNLRESVLLGLLLADHEKNYVTYAAGDPV